MRYSWSGVMIWGVILLLITRNIANPQNANKDIAVYADKVVWGKKKTVLTFDPVDAKVPASLDGFQTVFHFPPIRQDTTGTCWCFAGISFLESELARLTKGEIKLSELYVVYWEYVEKARRYIHEKGDSEFGQGSQPQAVIERAKQYGLVRAEDYTGLLPGKTNHNHRELFREIRTFLKYLQEKQNWDEESAIGYIKSILNRHLGKPPETIIVDGEEMTPKEYAHQVLKLPLNDYISLMSFKKIPFYTRGEYQVPDNWWHDSTYYNVPLRGFYEALKLAIKNGYTVAIAGDVSEPGKLKERDIAIIPSFDIAQSNIDQNSREFRFYNKASTDDHCIHIVGYQKYEGRDWFLIKDSGSSAHDGNFKGYYFFRDDYIRLKMLTYLIHKDAVKDILTRFK